MPARRSLAYLLAVALPLGTLVPDTALAQDPSAEQDPIDNARKLYQQGSTLYSAADYPGAIEKFTEALGIITAEGSAEHASIRGALLFNIARSHSNAYEVDRDVAHLRTARSIFERFVAESEGGGYEENDVADAKLEITRIDGVLEDLETDPDPGPGPLPGPSPRDEALEKKIKSTRTQGIVFTAIGAAAVPTGVVLLALGATERSRTCAEYEAEPAARRNGVECDEIYDTPDSVDTAADNGLEVDMRRNRRISIGQMAAGGVVLGVGAVGLALGITQLVRAKSMADKNKQKALSTLRASPWMGREGAGLTLSGRF